jgi:ElaB/YqjD/DUF883 family membrane-anchored ribosome-binding protein
MAAQSGSRISGHELEDGPIVGVARQAESAVRVTQERAKAALEASSEFVQENPLKTVLIAAGVGALVGYMIGRRR